MNTKKSNELKALYYSPRGKWIGKIAVLISNTGFFFLILKGVTLLLMLDETDERSRQMLLTLSTVLGILFGTIFGLVISFLGNLYEIYLKVFYRLGMRPTTQEQMNFFTRRKQELEEKLINLNDEENLLVEQLTEERKEIREELNQLSVSS